MKDRHLEDPAWCGRIGGPVTLSATGVCPECGWRKPGPLHHHGLTPTFSRQQVLGLVEQRLESADSPEAVALLASAWCALVDGHGTR
jgi:hypothetical protein